MVGFSYKTSWLAVRGRTAEDVADALALYDREVLDWAAGTERAYQFGVYVATAVPGWTLAHGRRDLSAFDATDPRFCDWLRQLSRSLGEIQYFANERVPEYHVWAWARDGQLLRAYCFIGERGEVPLFVGEPTADEVALGKGTRGGPEAGWETWLDEEWAAWFATTPSESDVMAVAGCWSVDPNTIDDAGVTAAGIYGLSPGGRRGTPLEAVEPSLAEAETEKAVKNAEDAAFWRRFRTGDHPSGQ